MIGFEDAPEHSAEICIFEFKSENLGQISLTIGFGIYSFQALTFTDEFFEETFAIDTSEFNVYAAEWAPTGVAFYINRVKIKTVDHIPAISCAIYAKHIRDVLEGKQHQEKMEPIIDYVYGYRSVKF